MKKAKVIITDEEGNQSTTVIEIKHSEGVRIHTEYYPPLEPKHKSFMLELTQHLIKSFTKQLYK